MAETHELRCYEYVNRPYAVVREGLIEDSQSIFQRATLGAADRASAVAANLRVDLGALEIGADIEIEIRGVTEESASVIGRGPTTCISLAWKAARAPALFPSMSAELRIYALSPHETQLDLRGVYRPPLGALGAAVDSLVGHRVAEASVHRFLADVAALLKQSLPAA